MLTKLKSIYTDAKIWVLFIPHENRLRAEHQAEADRLFPVEELHEEIMGLHKAAAAKADRKFGEDLRKAIAAREKAHRQLKEREAELLLLERDLETEIRTVKKALHSEHDQLAQLKRTKHGAEGEKRKVARRISDFHDSTKDFWGNRDHVPQSAWFGPSWNKYDAIKDDMDNAMGRLLDINEAIGKVQGRILDLEDERREIFKAKDQKRAMVSKGATIGSVKRAMSLITEDIHCFEKRATDIKDQMDELIYELGLQNGLAGKALNRRAVSKAKKDFIQSFEEDEARQARRLAFRKAILEK